VDKAVRAAAPILTRAAREQELRDAADEIGNLPPQGFGDLYARDWLRQRADRIGGGQ
jgi:hypothetical protein